MASGLTAIAAGATLAFGAFGAGLADFTALTADNTLDSPIIVIGDSARTVDVIGGMDVSLALGGYVTKDAVVAGAAGTASASGTDDIMLSTDLNKTYISNTAGARTFAQARSTLTDTVLPVLLKTQSFTDKASSTISISQNMALGSQSVDYGKVGDATTPDLYVTMGQSYPYTLTVNFLGGLDTAQVDTNYKLTLFNKEYTFGSTVSNTTVELYSATGAQTLTLTDSGDEKSVTIGGTAHTVKLNGWNTGGTGVYMLIDGAATSPAMWSSGSTYTFPGTTTKVYVKEVGVVNTGGAQGGATTGQVTLFIGTDKLTINNATTVSKNDDALTGVTATMSASGTKINSIIFSVAPAIDTYLTDGGTFTDPLFGSFKFALSGMNPAVDSSARDLVKIAKSGSSKVKLTFTNKAGTEYAQDVYSYSTTGSMWKLSPDGTNELWTKEGNSTATSAYQFVSTGDYFVLSSSNKNSYIFKYIGFDPTTGRKKATFADASTGTQYKVYESDPYIRIGSDDFKIEGFDSSGSPYNLSVDLDGSKTVVFDTNVTTLYTKSGSTIVLGSGGSATVNTLVNEYKLYPIATSNEPGVGTYNVSTSYASNDVSLGLNFTDVAQVASTNENKGISDYGTYVNYNTDSDTVALYLPGDRPAYANVAIGIDPVITTSGANAGGTFKEAVPVKNPVAKFAAEVDTAMKTGKHLILIGGPCANALTATALNMSSTSPACYNEFKAAYPTTGVVKVVDGAFAAGKKALVIAGLDGDKTRMLADSYVIKNTLDYSG